MPASPGLWRRRLSALGGGSGRRLALVTDAVGHPPNQATRRSSDHWLSTTTGWTSKTGSEFFERTSWTNYPVVCHRYGMCPAPEDLEAARKRVEDEKDDGP
jgi:hypothetical protein